MTGDGDHGDQQPAGTATRRAGSRRGGVRDRDVIAVAAAVVGLVLVANVASGVVRPLDDLLGVAPIVVILLVAVTVLVLLRSVRRGGAAQGGESEPPPS
jgi:hypothetical protein